MEKNIYRHQSVMYGYRRASCYRYQNGWSLILHLIISYFSSIGTEKWKDFISIVFLTLGEGANI